ncbi:MAG: hypothetical protein OXI81_03235 [Paracoccaceae bacterium]|nr:hypothetical protein [Paracoccaceae bacterium]
MMTARPSAVFAATLWVSFSMLANGAVADNGFLDRIEISGRLSAESRQFPDSPAHSGQGSHASGFAFEATGYVEGDDGGSFSITPFFRYDAGDPSRTHFDLREAYYLTYGDVGDSEWELRLGFDRVFWGVVESNSLVDIVNQFDLLEQPSGKTKLGQPMAHVTLSGDWGALEFFGLTWHRPREFPDMRGRLRSGIVVDPDLISYESAAQEWHVDLAGRYSGSFGLLDIGLSVFDGHSRDPTLMPAASSSGLVLAPHYERIRQFGLDAQLTIDAWLLKLEAIHRAGSRNRQLQEEDYTAFTAGGEYTLYSVFDSSADVSLFAELSRDGRGRNATSSFENDVLLATRVGFNDEFDTEFSLSVLASLDSSSRFVVAEFRRRLTDRWSFRADSTVYVDIDKDDVAYDVRNDSFIEMKLDFNF